MNPKSPYQVLGVSESVRPDELKQVYRRLAMRYHPDVNPNDPTTTAKFIAVKNAMELLSDPIRLARYQRKQASIARRKAQAAARKRAAQSPGATRAKAAAQTPRSRSSQAGARAGKYASTRPGPSAQAYSQATPEYAPPKPKASAPFLMKVEHFLFTAPLHYYLLASAAFNFLLSLYNTIMGVVPLEFVYERRVSPIAMEAFSFTGRMLLMAIGLTIVAMAGKYLVQYCCNEWYRKKSGKKSAYA